MEVFPSIEDLRSWADRLEEVQERLAPYFERAEPRQRAMAYLRGLLSSTERKNGWQLAELAGEATPDGMQRLLNTAKWDAEQVRDDLQEYILAHLADPEAVLVVDETGFVKKGNEVGGRGGPIQREQLARSPIVRSESFWPMPIGMERYCSTGNCICMPTGRRTPSGARRQRCPEERRTTITEADAGQADARARLCPRGQSGLGDRRYGLWRGLQTAQLAGGAPAALRVGRPEESAYWAHPTRRCCRGKLARRRPGSAYRREKAVKGLASMTGPGSRLDFRWTEPGWKQWLLARRSLSDPTEIAYYFVFAPETVSLEQVVRAAGSRWQVEEAFELAKRQVGLDEYEVRHWQGWYRHITLAMFALAFLTVVKVAGQKRGPIFRSKKPLSSSL